MPDQHSGVHFPDITIETCSSGADALRFIFAKPSYVVVSDIRMREMNGFELLTRVKAARSEIPVILTTGEADTSIRGGTRHCRAAFHMEKVNWTTEKPTQRCLGEGVW